ncbi:MAG: hypothetical protein JWR77_491 [Rhizorhabdus sp.]|nr:hypothetical protein [Rhizorhabdus sp.]
MLPLFLLLFVCIAVPLGCAWHLWRLDTPSMAGWLIACLATVVGSILILLVSRWDIAGLGTRYLVAGLVLVAGLASLRRHMGRPWLVAGWTEVWHRHSASLASLVLLGGAFVYVLMGMRSQPAAHAMSFPLKGGRFVIGQGGNNSLLNYHHDHRAQRYASDISAVNAAGFRALSPLPRDLSDYAIFGASVTSPCRGTVIQSIDGLPDLIPPMRDRDNARGNHVAIACNGVRVELAHLKERSVAVRVGEQVSPGDRLGQVGNSGNTSEPHLHIHAVDLATGIGIPLVFDGIAPVRNTVFERGAMRFPS